MLTLLRMDVPTLGEEARGAVCAVGTAEGLSRSDGGGPVSPRDSCLRGDGDRDEDEDGDGDAGL